MAICPSGKKGSPQSIVSVGVAKQHQEITSHVVNLL